MAFLRNAITLFVCFQVLAFGLLSPAGATTPLGQDVTNVAQLTIADPSGPVTYDTNPATFKVVALPTPSEIEFFRVIAAAPDAFQVSLNGSEFSPSGETGPGQFQPIGDAITTGGQIVDTANPVLLTSADTYFTGELMIVRVIDRGQNGDPAGIETVITTISTTGGDSIVLRLYESGPDTGEFYAWVPSTGLQTPQNDAQLTAPKDTRLTARYVDVFDATEVSVDTALVDPFGRLFDSLTGELIDGAEVTIVEDVSGLPAAVFGIDGLSAYPSTLITGSTVTDAGGTVYDLEQGEFLFPLMAPGAYRLVITPPAEYTFPSGVAPGSFAALPNAPFEIIDGSYGAAFQVEATGPLNLDVPLDTTRGLTVFKRTSTRSASIGDFVSYTVTVENTESAAIPLIIEDYLPRGFRYQDGSARLDNVALDSVGVAENGTMISFDGGWIEAGARRNLTYVLSIGSGALTGEAVNAARAVSPAGMALSNVAEAAIQIEEELLSSKFTLVGRVVEDACDGDEDWAREIEDGVGVPGVRLYLETGEYVVSDEDGLYHFEGLDARTHVVQLDLATLPKGYEPMVCEDTTRYAGSATSQFVDVRGGAIWRANFYLKRSNDVELEVEAPAVDANTEYLDYDHKWLEAQSRETGWAYPLDGYVPNKRSMNIGFTAPSGVAVDLTLNGRAVPELNKMTRIVTADGDHTLHRWRGVDIQIGENVFTMVVTHPDGRTEQARKDIWFVEDAQRAVLVDDQSVLVADGRTPPVLALRLEDADGRSVHAGRRIDVSVGAPYRLKIDSEIEDEDSLVGTRIEAPGVDVGTDGIVRVELEPTLQTGRVRLQVPLREGRIEEITAYIRPEKRDWIVVGLAEGELAALHTDEASELSADELMHNGRLALFAKGMIRGDWLLTLAVDTAKRRGAVDDELFETIDPNAYYTLYGDRTYQDHEAESRYPVYVKLERDTAQVLFGDFTTDLNDSELSRYSRRLSGVRGIHEGRRFSATVFAAETNQGFVQDEIASDGTSGPYQLSASPIVRNSETIVVETRDRLRPDEVVATRILTQYTDYTLDYETGELILRVPVDATDLAFNDNVLVVEYETFTQAERNLTYGGRLAMRSRSGRIEAGLTHVHEEGGDEASAEANLFGADVTIQLTDQTDVRLEYATTTRKPGLDGSNEQSGEAWLAEVLHQSENFSLGGYIREEGAGFAVGQTGSNTESIRRFGATGTATLHQSVDETTGMRVGRSLNAQAYREEALESGAERTVGELILLDTRNTLNTGLGLRVVDENSIDGPRQSVQATGTLSKIFPEQGLTVSLSRDQIINQGNGDEVSLFPNRTLIGIDKQISQRAVVNLRHDIQDGENAGGQNTIVGLSLVPWIGGRVSTSVNQVTQDSGERLSATVGVDQLVQLSPTWTMSLGGANRQQISGDDAPADPLSDEAISPLAEGDRSVLTQAEGFSSAYGGLGYRDDTMAGSARVEWRNSVDNTRYAGIFGAAREVTQNLSFAGAGRYQVDDTDNASKIKTFDARIASAYRPRGEGVVVLNRFDVRADSETAAGEPTVETWKLINNLGVNWQADARTQVSGFYGVKYTDTELMDQEFTGFTQLIGGELRYDVTERVDIGVHGFALHTGADNTTQYAFGPSIGVSPVDNAWVSLGYNVTGFQDRDFEAAEYADHGIFLKARFKFDQSALEGFLDRISPQAR
ncbi:MAG: hypothetical protein AAF216_00720 [Pseudomonadota bacterium]